MGLHGPCCSADYGPVVLLPSSCSASPQDYATPFTACGLALPSSGDESEVLNHPSNRAMAVRREDLLHFPLSTGDGLSHYKNFPSQDKGSHTSVSTQQGKSNQCKQHHVHNIAHQHDREDIILINRLITIHGKKGNLEKARILFDQTRHRTVVTWTAMITAYSHQGYHSKALEVFWEMQGSVIQLNEITFTSILGSCASLELLIEGHSIHMDIVRHGFESDVFVGTALINMYGKCRAVADARTIFDGMILRNLATWNTMITVYAQQEMGFEALELLRRMHLEGIEPDRITSISVLGACGSSTSLEDGQITHCWIIRNELEKDAVVGTALVDMYGKCGALAEAQMCFHDIHQWTVVSWNAMIAAYIDHGCAREALQLFQEMELSRTSVPDEVTCISILHACAVLGNELQGRRLYAHIIKHGFIPRAALETALVDMYGKWGNLDEACYIFYQMSQQDLVSWTVIITAHVEEGQGRYALLLFHAMQEEGIEPDVVIFISVLGACASLGALDEGRTIHVHITSGGFCSNIVVANALINMYGRCGALADALTMFDRLHERNAVTWNTVIAAYAHLGAGKEVLRLYQEMQQAHVFPNEVTFVHILSACTHEGLVKEGLHLFASMIHDFGLLPSMEHYGCLVDLLGKFGKVSEAEDFVCCMPVAPDIHVWIILLGACKIHGQSVVGNFAADCVVRVDPDNAAPYVSLFNIYGG